MVLLSHGRDGFAYEFYTSTDTRGEEESYALSRVTACMAIINLLCLIGDEAERKGDKATAKAALKVLKAMAEFDPRLAAIINK